jgi:hypothetical protein
MATTKVVTSKGEPQHNKDSQPQRGHGSPYINRIFILSEVRDGKGMQEISNEA